MLWIVGGWIIIITGRIAVWIIWVRQLLRLSVLSKAPVPSALLKTKRMSVKYSHNTWTNIGSRPMSGFVSLAFLEFEQWVDYSDTL